MSSRTHAEGTSAASPQPAPQERFRVLGTVSAVHADGSSAVLPRPRQRALLAALLLRAGRPVPTDRLIDEIWGGEAAPAQPGPALHTLVTRLRTYLEGTPVGAAALVTNPLGYVLEVDPDQMDSGRFDALRRQSVSAPAAAAVPILEEALGLWAGDPYPGVDFEAARLEAIRLEEARLGALEALGRALLGSGRTGQALEVVESLVADQPLREGAREVHIRALYDVGRQADALATYDDYRRRVADELGLEPPSRLAALQLAVLRHELPPAQDGVAVPPVNDTVRGTEAGAEDTSVAANRRPAGLGSLRVRYAAGPAGRIAYATAGTGPLLLHLPAWVTSIDVIGAGRDPRSSLLDRLARHYQVVLYDRGGSGLSRDSEPRADLETAVAEAVAVIEAVGAPVHLLGMSQAGPVAIRVAVDRPDLVRRLVLMGTYASGAATFDNEAMQTSVVALMRAHWGMGSRALADLYRPSPSAVAVDHLARVLRDSAPGPVAADFLEAVFDVEVAELLRRVEASTLVVHYRNDRLVPFRGGHELAAGLSDARLLALDGGWHLPDVHDLDRIESAIVDHLGG